MMKNNKMEQVPYINIILKECKMILIFFNKIKLRSALMKYIMTIQVKYQKGDVQDQV